jgi:hypothetical protein
LQNESVRKDVAKTHPAASIAPIQSSTMWYLNYFIGQLEKKRRGLKCRKKECLDKVNKE